MLRTRHVTRTFAGLASGVLAVSGALVASSAIVTSGAGPAGAAVTKTFTFTGAEEAWTVPTGVTSITMTVLGAQGGDGSVVPAAGTAASGGLGGRTIATIAVTPGEVLRIYVGGQGTGSPVGSAAPGGFNGGGAAGTNTDGLTRPGSGGGASDVRQGGSALANRVVVAGGGGGAGGLDSYGNGGAGGQIGGPGIPPGVSGAAQSGTGGASSAGGAPGTGATFGGVACTANGGTGGFGALGVGGVGGAPGGPTAGQSGGGGGGGGRFGGGGGGGACDQNLIAASGGGGSGYADPGATSVSFATGVRSGNGRITFTYDVALASNTALASGLNPSGTGTNVTFTATVTRPDTSPMTGGTVTFTADGTTIAGCEDVAVNGSGIATCTTNALPVGANAIVATFSGFDEYDSSVSPTVTQNVVPNPTITLTPSANPIAAGEPLTLTVTVSGSGPTPTGTIQVNESGLALPNCNFIGLVGGTVSCTVSTLSIGNHDLYVNYSGDANYAALGTQAQYTQVVTADAPTTTTTPTPTVPAGGGGTSTAVTGADSVPVTLVGLAFLVVGALLTAGARLLRRRVA